MLVKLRDVLRERHTGRGLTGQSRPALGATIHAQGPLIPHYQLSPDRGGHPLDFGCGATIRRCDFLRTSLVCADCFFFDGVAVASL